MGKEKVKMSVEQGVQTAIDLASESFKLTTQLTERVGILEEEVVYYKERIKTLQEDIDLLEQQIRNMKILSGNIK